MIWLDVKRVAKAGFVNFWRNGVVSIASVFVATVTLYTVGILLLSSAFLQASISEIKNKVDINVYFEKDAPIDQIEGLTNRLRSLPEVKDVEYVSREQALVVFKERNKDNALIIQSLNELPDNPLGAVLNIRAKEPSQYEGIATFLNQQKEKAVSASGASIIDSVNYQKNKIVIDRLTAIVSAVERLGFMASLILGLMAILVTFNTIRLAIYNSREEITVMKLVGASRSYIRGPFVIEGLMYGVSAAILATFALYPTTFWIRNTTTSFFGSFNLLTYYLSNLGQIFLVLLGTGVVLGMVSSFFAIRKYLK
ncbi:hypothetical protein A3A21_02965 [Candidatus Jorgensenbacteria bacterium RIFCSPLOWO2_01_FULL_45_25b]|uniref:Cell division protein FtsX n=1 Tax=Candidatus Jorgensenbacteria bacterium RIFCSPLOWO2_01_FULL_45_25b TaxID=1798471 RepID=A0A1F6BXK5_9BACT|nr:MAG: hypothetical protein A3A21_02965 [Candidatus Jorgensenbacteria bacterium RIFCSPLOWO2_01_FULL_45_25b]